MCNGKQGAIHAATSAAVFLICTFGCALGAIIAPYVVLTCPSYASSFNLVSVTVSGSNSGPPQSIVSAPSSMVMYSDIASGRGPAGSSYFNCPTPSSILQADVCTLTANAAVLGPTGVALFCLGGLLAAVSALFTIMRVCRLRENAAAQPNSVKRAKTCATRCAATILPSVFSFLLCLGASIIAWLAIGPLGVFFATGSTHACSGGALPTAATGVGSALAGALVATSFLGMVLDASCAYALLLGYGAVFLSHSSLALSHPQPTAAAKQSASQTRQKQPP